MSHLMYQRACPHQQRWKIFTHGLDRVGCQNSPSATIQHLSSKLRYTLGIKHIFTPRGRVSSAAIIDFLFTTVPPFGCRICPVMQEESSEARKAKLGAISSGWPRILRTLLGGLVDQDLPD